MSLLVVLITGILLCPLSDALRRNKYSYFDTNSK